jgi:hypothetical protein
MLRGPRESKGSEGGQQGVKWGFQIQPKSKNRSGFENQDVGHFSLATGHVKH